MPHETTMPISHPLAENMPEGSMGQRILPELIDAARAANVPAEFLSSALLHIKNQLGVDSAAVVEGVKGTWRIVNGSNPDQPIPNEFLSETLDRYGFESQPPWYATPLHPSKSSGLLVLINSQTPLGKQELSSVSTALAAAWQLVDRFTEANDRAIRNSAMLEMTIRWNQTMETAELLETMARTSTQLLGAERATIFLLDPQTSQLIGRPALGVEGGELRISGDTGVVGQVVQSGQPQRVDADIDTEQSQIDRAVDEALGFQTRSLLCVPMFGSADKVIGAFELLNKVDGNFSDADQIALTELAGHAAVAIENTQHVENLRSSQRHVADEAAEKVQLIGQCTAMKNLKSSVERVAETDLSVLVLGENGTGKEVIAQLVHYLSPRRDNVLVAVNCAAITETLLESELFGHEKGAFTDAHDARPGKFELANGGTLFLDEIGDMSLGGQSKLLRVLEEKVVVRVGGSTPIPTDARVMAATNQDLGQLVREKKFREDLFFRLNVVTLELPPLRERGDDIMLLAENFLGDFCSRARRKVPKFSAAAKKKLLGHSWPGNVRELRNMMERLAYLFADEKVDAGDLSFVMSPSENRDAVPMDQPLADATRMFQADYIQRHIKRARGNMTDAAERLGLHRSNLYRKMKQLDMHGTDENPDESGQSRG